MGHLSVLIEPLHLHHANSALPAHLNRTKDVCQAKGDALAAPHVGRHVVHLSGLVGRHDVALLNEQAAPPLFCLPRLLPTLKVLTQQRGAVRWPPLVHSTRRRTRRASQDRLLGALMARTKSSVLGLQLLNTSTKRHTIAARAARRRPSSSELGLQGRHLDEQGP
jgi:hypothetical protein